MTTGSIASGDGMWGPVQKFEFQVVEYLKGSGPNTITAIVDVGESWLDTEAAANKIAAQAYHDDTYHDRQAILFLQERDDLGSDEYYLGVDYMYSITSEYRRVWLPAVATTTDAGSKDSKDVRAPADPEFLLAVERPAGYRSPSGARSSSGVSTITLSALKTLIADTEATVTQDDPEFRGCVEEGHREAQYQQHYWRGTKDHGSIQSGQPQGTVVYEPIGGGAVSSTLYTGEHRFEGRDAEYVTIRFSDFEPPEDGIRYTRVTRRIVTQRPLIAGEYEFYYNHYGPQIMWCRARGDVPASWGKNHKLRTFNVEAPERTVHEFFFDPTTIGTAVGADASNGVLNPNAFSLDGATTIISSLKWEDGAISMTLSPTASLDDYAIDFIDITGTTTLSLTSRNASTTALTWTVPGKPWNDGDLLMLRIHEPAPPEPVTVTLSPRLDGSATYTNIAIQWNDPQPCDGQYFVALYTSADYLVTFLDFLPAPQTTSLTAELGVRWEFDGFPDYWAGVSCDPSDWSGRRSLGRASLIAAHPDNN